MPPSGLETRTRLLEAALTVIRTQGFAATTVDDLCRAAGVSKGAFFHHFDSKEALALAAVAHWNATTGALFAAAPYHQPADPAERVLAYVAFRRAILVGTLPEWTCLLGTLVQETYATHPTLRAACCDGILGHAATLEADCAAALAARALPLDGHSLAVHAQAVLQGAFILAKATGSSAVAADSVDHLQRYLRLLFGMPTDLPPAQVTLPFPPPEIPAVPTGACDE